MNFPTQRRPLYRVEDSWVGPPLAGHGEQSRDHVCIHNEYLSICNVKKYWTFETVLNFYNFKQRHSVLNINEYRFCLTFSHFSGLIGNTHYKKSTMVSGMIVSSSMLLIGVRVLLHPTSKSPCLVALAAITISLETGSLEELRVLWMLGQVTEDEMSLMLTWYPYSKAVSTLFLLIYENRIKLFLVLFSNY